MPKPLATEMARLNGFAAGVNGKTMSDCPYGQSTYVAARRRAWIEGFDDGVIERCKQKSSPSASTNEVKE